MQLLHAGVDTTVIALWLGHEKVDTTQIYLHADLAIKERRLPALHNALLNLGAIDPQTQCLPTLSRSDYADLDGLISL